MRKDDDEECEILFLQDAWNDCMTYQPINVQKNIPW